jgi:hypothetical protein
MRVIFLLRAAGVMLALLVAGFVLFLPPSNSAPLRLTVDPPVVVDRTLKGNRSPVLAPTGTPRRVGLPPTPHQSPANEKRSPWCEGAFGPTASPPLQSVLQRCTV